MPSRVVGSPDQIEIWRLSDSFPYASISGESPRFISQTISGPKMWPRKKNNRSSALAWQRTHHVRIIG